jgi:DNA-binding response OmpR family regulator
MPRQYAIYAAMPERRKGSMATTLQRAIANIPIPESGPATIDRIAVVSDDDAMQKILRRLFSSEGYEVDILPNSSFGLKALCQRPSSAVVLDVPDPDSSDCDLCKRIANLIPELPVIILAAGSELAYKARLLEMGGDDYLAIPFSPKDLLARVRTVIEHHSRTGLQDLFALES